MCCCSQMHAGMHEILGVMLQDLAVLCYNNLDLINNHMSIASLFAGLDMQRMMHPKFLLAATRQLQCKRPFHVPP